MANGLNIFQYSTLLLLKTLVCTCTAPYLMCPFPLFCPIVMVYWEPVAAVRLHCYDAYSVVWNLIMEK